MKTKLKPEAGTQVAQRLIVRFERNDKEKVARAAAAAGVPAAEFIRQAVAEKMADSSQYGEALEEWPAGRLVLTKEAQAA